ncbi:patched domain-containing protein 3-like [Mytilus edulis]|uniref:patched domain-containing protein 3-like n=1 Tax=Mytilus edulis TaxID=6550 RepID=UPI0039F1030C
MNIFYRLHIKVEEFFGGLFERHGRFVARHPWAVIIGVVIIDIGLGLGLLKIQTDNSIEQYAPKDSTASKHREEVYSMFPNVDTANNFYQHSLISYSQYAIVIAQRKDGGNIVDSSSLSDVEALYNHTVSISINSSGSTYKYNDVCAKRFSSCVIDGNYIFSSDFKNDLSTGNISYPSYTTSGQTFNIRDTFGKSVASGGFLESAVAIRLTFSVAGNSVSDDWQDAFIKKMKSYSSNTLNIDFAHGSSLDEELNANISGDITLFIVTFSLMITFSGLVLFGGNSVSNRWFLGTAGVVSTALAIVAALGFVSLCGVLFASIVGTMPFLVIGIGVDDMFILLSGLAQTSHIDNIETRIGKTMRTSGIAVTITSLTDVIAFCAGASSLFPAVKHFSLYTGTAILFCYLNYMTFFVSCMTLNERRVSQNRHFFTCRRVKTKHTMIDERKSKALILCCSGSPSKHRDEVEGPLEKYPKKLLKKILRFTPAKIIVLLLFAGFVGVSIYGAYHFKEGLDLKDLVSSDSYFYSFQESLTAFYDQGITIGLYVKSDVDYRSSDTLDAINSLRDNLQKDPDISDTFFLSWLHAYINSTFFDNSSNSNFVTGLQAFSATIEGNMYLNDVTFDNGNISASRFHILTESIASSGGQGDMMLRVRDIAANSPLPVFPYAGTFIYMEGFVAIYSQTLQTIGICVAAVFVVTSVFLPLPVMILFITITVILIMVSILGFMHFWGLTLSSVTMIHIIMCIGFCVDFATHICHAFAQAESTNRDDRVGMALDTAGGPILNGALSTIIGVIMLAPSKSFIFFSFFKVMFMVMLFGLIYSIFLLPVLLSFFGPKYVSKHSDKKDERSVDTENGMIRNSKCSNGTEHSTDTFITKKKPTTSQGGNTEKDSRNKKKKKKKRKKKRKHHEEDQAEEEERINERSRRTPKDLPPLKFYSKNEVSHSNRSFTNDEPVI